MIEYINCIICNKNVRLDNSSEIIKVRSNIRSFQDKKYSVWRCHYCNSIHSKQDINFEDFYKNYPIFDLKNKPFTNFTLSKRVKRLKKLGLKKSDTILDYGCGSGIMIYFLKKIGYKNAIGYDKYNKKFLNEKILDNKYDFIICQDVLEHSENPRLLLEKITKMLKKSGILSIGTTNADYIKLNNPEKYLMSLHQPYHRHIFSEKSLILLSKKIGLKVKKVYNRYYMNSIIPLVNHRFIIEYRSRKGNILEPIFGKRFDLKTILNHDIIFYAIFGYFFYPKTEMEILFQLSD